MRPNSNIELSKPRRTIQMPPSTAPTMELEVNTALATRPISVFEKPMSIRNGVNSLTANASPSLKINTSPSSDKAPRLPASSRSGSTTDSRSDPGGGPVAEIGGGRGQSPLLRLGQVGPVGVDHDVLTRREEHDRRRTDRHRK